MWNKLALKTAAWEATFMQRIMFNKWNVEAPEEMRTKHSVQTHRTPDDILKKISGEPGTRSPWPKNPFFKKVYDSQSMRAMCDSHSH